MLQFTLLQFTVQFTVQLTVQFTVQFTIQFTLQFQSQWFYVLRQISTWRLRAYLLRYGAHTVWYLVGFSVATHLQCFCVLLIVSEMRGATK